MVLAGVTTKVRVAHVRLCHSRMFLVGAYPRESQEMVFDAHDRAFRFFGGACRRGIYDNMTAVETAVRDRHAGGRVGEGAGREPGRHDPRDRQGYRSTPELFQCNRAPGVQGQDDRAEQPPCRLSRPLPGDKRRSRTPGPLRRQQVLGRRVPAGGDRRPLGILWFPDLQGDLPMGDLLVSWPAGSAREASCRHLLPGRAVGARSAGGWRCSDRFRCQAWYRASGAMEVDELNARRLFGTSGPCVAYARRHGATRWIQGDRTIWQVSSRTSARFPGRLCRERPFDGFHAVPPKRRVCCGEDLP